MIGLVDRERIDEELYDDFETAKAREVCMFLWVHFFFFCQSIWLNFEIPLLSLHVW